MLQQLLQVKSEINLLSGITQNWVSQVASSLGILIQALTSEILNDVRSRTHVLHYFVC